MKSAADPRFRGLVAATAAAVYLLIIVGGIVRTTGSGLGCPDWPLCYGRALPPPEITAWIEFSHRFIAAVAGLLMLATLVLAWRYYRRVRAVFIPAALAVGLLVFQVPAGAVVVLTELQPLIVGFHLTMAMLIFACLLVVATAATRRMGGPTRSAEGPQPGLRLVAGAAIFIVLLTGAWVVGSRAQIACPDWPLCYGRLLPPPGAGPMVWVQIIHRYTVAAVSIPVIALIVDAFRRPRLPREVIIWTAWLGALFAMQIMVGAMQVLFVLPTVWRVLHLAFAAGIWGVLVILESLDRLARRPALLEAAEPAAQPAGKDARSGAPAGN